MNPISGEITFHEVNGVTIATVAFESIDVKFYMAVENVGDIKRQFDAMLRDHEQVRGIFDRTGRLDWPAMEAACSQTATGSPLGVDDVRDIVRDGPSPYDDLQAGIRSLSAFLWSKPGIPLDVRERAREWIRGAIDLMRVAEYR